MKIKIDENLPNELFEFLLSQRHDVHTVQTENLVGRDDHSIFTAAHSEGRLLITQDLDFSDVRTSKPGTHPGIVLVRLRHPSRLRLIERFQKIIESEAIDAWSGCFVVITDRKL